MTLLTPNFADRLKLNEPTISTGNGDGRPYIVQAHEPLKNEPWAIPTDLLAVGPAVVVPITEQIVNAAPVAEPLKIALIGTAPSSRMLAPYSDQSWKIWACSPGNTPNVLPRIDAWFEIHKNLLWPEYKHYGEPYIAWLKQQTFPIYMQDQSLVPNAISLPTKELVQEFGQYFFTSTFAWMLAMAMKSGASEIALYGIDMASRDEYMLQRHGAFFFFGEAAKRGIKITAPYESDILQPPGLYGFSEVTPFGRKILARQTEIKERLTGMRQQRDSLAHNITYLEGALEDLDYIQSIWSGAQNNSLPDGQG